ncbi:MAG: YceI family protein [Opitutaceae bacterium]
MRHRRLLALLLAAMPALGLAAPLQVNPSTVKLTVDARATMHSFTGAVANPAVSIEGDAASGTITAATVRFAWADLKTGDKARDRDLLEWATAKSAEGVFTLVKLTPGASADAFTAAGTLALNGQTRELSFPVKIVRTTAGWDISGEAKIDHRDWGLPKIRKFGMLTVDPVVTIRFALAAAPGA